ncbi:hypothetical protein [Olsenella sp. oral taxon 809]|uniref:hypothetical protein n=1 Tax=Olsenella sp. oral taxon 809 TaxID=661086 RepID=UPI0002EABA08|nr:hypothetical protein [Olsenella sp. oral taxon 809]
MSIFDKFNNQGLDDDGAFEELCCQLFETWGVRAMLFDASWEYLDIRGDGGDGGVEAYWHNTNDDSYIGMQAKWFRKTIAKSQYEQIKKSIDTAIKLRPSITQYIICVPHNLTSLRNSKGGTTSLGEEGDWKKFHDNIAQSHPDLELLLWDEHHIGSLLTEPANEGRWHFWFEKSAVNPENVRLALNETIEGLEDRYVPEVTDDGELAIFLDNFFGSTKSRLRIIKDIDAYLDLCHTLSYATDSFVGVGDGLSDELKNSDIKCHDAICAYADSLYVWRQSLMTEPRDLIEIENIAVDYEAIENFESDIQDLKEKHKLTGHVDELIKLIGRFRELPSEYEIRRTMRNTLSCPHCLVIGGQGTGKTCGFASEASSFLGDGKHLPILIRAGDVNDRDGWREIISNALGLAGWTEAELWQALSASAAMHDMRDGGITVRAKVAIFVDGLDERQPASSWTTLIRQGDAITKEYPRIKFAYSSRPHGIERTNTDDLWECFYRIEDSGDVPAWELFDRYIDYYSIDLAGNTRYKWVLRTPMELRMFCAAYGGRRIDKEVSTCLTALVNAEVDRLDKEYAARNARILSMHETPVGTTLIALASAFLEDDSPRDLKAIGSVVEGAGMQREDVNGMLDFLERYGILATVRHPGATSVSPSIVMYQPGSRHLWDYFMAVVLMETEDATAAEALLRHGDAAYMYAILLIEKRGILPLKSEALVNVLGVDRVHKLTIDALASAEKGAAGKFKQWALDEMARSRESLVDIVNGIVARVADERDHPLGPTMLDEYMRTFPTPAERDRVWSIPRKMRDDYQLSIYYERDAARHLPRLHKGDAWSQMPLLLAWCLTTVSNLRRRHCRNELVQWALCNPDEYAELFDRLSDCNDPQVREDLFAIAEEVVCQGRVDTETKRRFARTTFNSVFSSPDEPGNRDAALRYYGRTLVEHCCADSTIDSIEIDSCRPPYGTNVGSDALPIYAAAANADRMSGYETINYNLARYVLVDKLERVFGIPQFHTDSGWNSNDALRLVRQSADMAGTNQPSFEGWVISAAYQYLVDHGYDPDVFVGPVGEKGYRLGGIDRKISGSFGSADHGSQSMVMTVAEKYVWCARNEICGFMADRIPVHKTAWQNGTAHETYELARDYSALLSYQSPLFEATVNALSAERADVTPSFPTAFSCDDGNTISSKQELDDWISSSSADDVVALLDHAPNVFLSIEGGVIPISMYASDWGVCGKEARCWSYCGAMDSAELAKLSEAGIVAIDGYDHASAFVAGIDVEATYISPVEYMSAPWINECLEDCERTKIADVHVTATPLSGRGVDGLTDIGDCWYRFPSKLAMGLCGVTRTDGARYYNAHDDVVFEDVDYGEPYRQHYQALLANRNKLFSTLSDRNLHPIWYATLQRSGNRLANERLPQLEARSEVSWLIWVDEDGKYRSCRMSDEYPVPEKTYEPSGVIKELIKKYAVERDKDTEETFD